MAQRVREFLLKIITVSAGKLFFSDSSTSIIGAFVEYNRYNFGAVLQSIIGRFLSIICLPLLAEY